MTTDDCSAELHPQAKAGLRLFNHGEYFEAHEALETAWRDERGSIRVLYQGILQVAVTYLHIGTGNYSGAVQLAERARAKLNQWPDQCRGVDVAQVRTDFEKVMEQVTRLGAEHLKDFDKTLFKPIHYK